VKRFHIVIDDTRSIGTRMQLKKGICKMVESLNRVIRVLGRYCSSTRIACRFGQMPELSRLTFFLDNYFRTGGVQFFGGLWTLECIHTVSIRLRTRVYVVLRVPGTLVLCIQVPCTVLRVRHKRSSRGVTHRTYRWWYKIQYGLCICQIKMSELRTLR
jgi:hypothetical protein